MLRVTYTIGTEKKWNGKPIWSDVAETLTKQACLSVAKVFGGYTKYDTSGGWVNASGELITERGIVISAVDATGKVSEKAVEELGAHLRDLFGQQCVLVVVDWPVARFV